MVRKATRVSRSTAKAATATPQPGPAESVGAVLQERGARYGSFADNARISQRLCEVIREENNRRPSRMLPAMQDHQLEALEMIAHKMARIITGDACYSDNWIDIAGYASLGDHPR